MVGVGRLMIASAMRMSMAALLSRIIAEGAASIASVPPTLLA